MENVIVNPENYQSEYIKYLNECFNHWGQEELYNWVFNRQVGDNASDIMILKNEEDEVIAGSGVTYRKLSTPSGKSIDIAIMTGSWTLPKARGKGCFSKIIALSQEIAHTKNVPYLTAFVTEQNASFRRLASAGSMLVPTSHLFSPEEPYAKADTSAIEVIKDEDKETIAAIYNRFKTLQKGSISFDYTKEEFNQQYINSPKKPEILKIGANYALIEETYNAVKVLLLTYENLGEFEHLVKALTNWALKDRSKKLFLFSTEKETIDVCENLGFENMKGYFTILATAPAAGTEIDAQLMQVNIRMGDKM
ncbi:GNAT family protein [Pontibacter pamirensis]|uniref:hypothetical protein n=1 Tax=Pontibacter pamirensis TaxID=2562824 RepID=UPI001389E99E|nr:hypothetical protein [Pontibacter pamirensis]